MKRVVMLGTSCALAVTLFAVAFLLPISSLAADLTTLSGKTYEKVRIQRVEPDGLYIFHSAGGAKIKFTDLPETIRKQYGYDPVKAAQFEKAQADLVARAVSPLWIRYVFIQGWTMGMSRHDEYSVDITFLGDATIICGTGGSEEYQLRLTEGSLAELQKLVRKADLPNQPLRKRSGEASSMFIGPVDGVPNSQRLYVMIDGKEKDFAGLERPAFRPLIDFITRLVEQARKTCKNMR